jgi:predicted DNA-binding protein
MSTISIRLSDEEDAVMRDYMKYFGISKISDFVKQAIYEKIEDDMDIELGKEALRRSQTETEFLTHDEFWGELGL